jgi:uncharacterized LabA/DUF88 family protein
MRSTPLRRAAGHYAYLDAGYFRERFQKRLIPLFAKVPACDFANLRQQLNVDRVFYYDCLDDLDADNHAVTAAKPQSVDYERVLKTDGYLPKLGTLSGGGPKKLGQKEVDVQLAVDMLTHAYDGLISEASVITGDLDFRPAMNVLVARGVHVRLVYDASSVNKNLFAASDIRKEIDLQFLFKCLDSETQRRNPFPVQCTWGQRPSGEVLRRGDVNGRRISLIEEGHVFAAIFDDDNIGYRHVNSDELADRYLPQLLPMLKWDSVVIPTGDGRRDSR